MRASQELCKDFSLTQREGRLTNPEPTGERMCKCESGLPTWVTYPEQNSLALRLPVFCFLFCFFKNSSGCSVWTTARSKVCVWTGGGWGSPAATISRHPNQCKHQGIIFIACSGASTLSTVPYCVICRVKPSNSSVHRQAGPASSHHTPKLEWVVTAF